MKLHNPFDVSEKIESPVLYFSMLFVLSFLVLALVVLFCMKPLIFICAIGALMPLRVIYAILKGK